ncbi:hypothetical protein [Salinispora mooreana]|uniref:hypothetical protein n=1 Tax=Salinispora mooreana TaxID=999545 RepID=UPI0013A56592|nr:hypothetical protein [Salinispora mooreana]
MYTRPVMAGLAIGGLLVGAGCSGESGSDAEAPSATAPASPSSTLVAAEQDAITAYNALWQSMAKAGEIPDPDAPELRQYASGDALTRVVRALVTYRETGVVTRGRPVNDPSVVSATATEVKLADCGDSTNWTTHTKSSGEPIEEDPRGRRRITATVNLAENAWEVTSFHLEEIGSC